MFNQQQIRNFLYAPVFRYIRSNFSGIAMSELFDTINDVRRSLKPYRDWVQEQNNIEERKKVLSQKYPPSSDQLKSAKNYNRTIIDTVNVMDEFSESKCQEMERATGMAQGLIGTGVLVGGILLGQKIIEKTKGSKTGVWLGNAVLILPVFASSVPLILWASEKQKKASRIARYQAREQELKDPKRFIVYTDEQLAQAQKKADSMPDIEDKKSLTRFIPLKEMFDTIESLNKDEKAYDKWSVEEAKEDQALKASNPNFSKQNMEKIKREQQIITNIVRKINIEAENYAEDIETSINTAATLSGFCGGIIGFFTGMGIEKLAASKNPSIKKMFSGKLKFLKNAKYIKAITAGAAGVLLPITITLSSVGLKKEAARVGRFKAKQELLKNPEDLMYFDENKMNSVKDIKSDKKEKGFIQDSIDSFKFMFTGHKDFAEYKKYKQEEQPKIKKLREALKTVKLNEGQLEEAKNLQEKTFNVFEKIDEKSQRYSEDMEAATEIAGEFVNLLPVVAYGAMAGVVWILNKTGLVTKEKIANYINSGKAEAMVRRNVNRIKKFSKAIGLTPLIEKIKKTKTAQKLKENIKKDLKTGANSIFEETVKNNEAPTKMRCIYHFIKQPTLKKLAIGTGIAIGLPIVATPIAAAYLLNAFLTKLQKDAGRIGIMKAMQELEDPRYFIDKYHTEKTDKKPEIKENAAIQKKSKVWDMFYSKNLPELKSADNNNYKSSNSWLQAKLEERKAQNAA